MKNKEAIKKMIKFLELEKENCEDQSCRNISDAKIQALEWVLK